MFYKYTQVISSYFVVDIMYCYGNEQDIDKCIVNVVYMLTKLRGYYERQQKVQWVCQEHGRVR